MLKDITYCLGISTGYCFHYLQRTGNDVLNTVIEVAGTSKGSMVVGYNPIGYYHHCNMYVSFSLLYTFIYDFLFFAFITLL